jgi:predicted N-acetyltransferase YhbS
MCSDLVLRPEEIGDFSDIADLIAASFEVNFLDENRPSWFLGEIPLVDYLRRQPSYVNDLALVAILDSSIVGYIMLAPFPVSLSGNSCIPVLLAILAVAPAHQRRGIGTCLVRESLVRASKQNHPFCYLLGHPSYYPRFGFQPLMFGETFVEVARCDFPSSGLKAEQVQPMHLQRLCENAQNFVRGYRSGVSAERDDLGMEKLRELP